MILLWWYLIQLHSLTVPLSVREGETDWRDDSLTFVFGSKISSPLGLKKQICFQEKEKKNKLHLEADNKLTKTKPHARNIDLVSCKSTFTAIPT